ncbi:hypothetical protein [Okeania sp. SIO1I7]|uniref:hypothetical protein n=1 Tax=Okeania sp. SIO1I7 TaxID=2607772 RepID=UPI0013F79B8E|nr:hypothetical protein [Okeania sp. SIO1I7]NET27504.1 hypothetical protein [Okeania sp. SIO1I7]
MGRWGDGGMRRWGDGGMGRWEMGRWGDGEMGRWGDGEMGDGDICIFAQLNVLHINILPRQLISPAPRRGSKNQNN